MQKTNNAKGGTMFSVIIPAYNAASYIHNSINSVLCQTISDFEVLVIDDGSTDDTRAVVNSIQDKRIRYVYQSNSGVSSARNTGINNAKGEYVCFLDADDLWKPHHLEVITRLIEKYPDTDVYMTGYEILLNNGQVIQKVCPDIRDDKQSNNVFKQIWEHGYFIHTNSIACKATVFDVAGLFEIGVRNGEDDDMWYRLFSYFSAAISSEITTAYIRENSNATQSRTFVEDWVFYKRLDGIMVSDAVSDEKKQYLRLLIEQRKLSFIRYCLVNGDKKTAWKQMKTIDKKLLKKKKKVLTLVAFLIPSSVSAFLVNIRDKEYYSE